MSRTYCVMRADTDAILLENELTWASSHQVEAQQYVPATYPCLVRAQRAAARWKDFGAVAVRYA